MNGNGPDRHDGPHSEVPHDLLATTDLVFSGLTPRGEPPGGGVSLGRPLAYVLRDVIGDSPPAVDAPGTVLLCFPFDLEELSGGWGYRQIELTVGFDDADVLALELHPRPGGEETNGACVAVFGLGRNRLRWVFRAPEADGTLRPDGRWTQAVLRLPSLFSGVSGRLALRGVIEHPLLSGTRAEAEVHTRDELPFRVSRVDAWTGAPLARQAPQPGAWALAAFEDFGTTDEQLPPGRQQLCFAVDIEKYSAHRNADMIRLQRALLRIMRAACVRAEVDWYSCGRQAQGDGYLLVLPPDTDETRVVPRLMDGLADALAVVNREESVSAPDRPPLRTRMRAAFHHGVLHEADSGYAGSAVVELFRLLDSDPLRALLTDEQATDLVIAFSDRLYQDLAVHGYEGLSPTGFEQLQVKVKQFTGTAWIRAHPRNPRFGGNAMPGERLLRDGPNALPPVPSADG
ncbi:hypothetical protein [Streptomyces sp. BPTC-684]|uniref:hypothetical protein n=1 Tax=Streptomyces sp. BPTC-684 TaxID=3043734 RepID=UPI0024B0DFAD|nr:hypothetical protein [Streptomyces sp. BPTC-684]WHM40033.1 hypothetical protein QIY60_26375 [Streptomyces sp. BPTC-684]